MPETKHPSVKANSVQRSVAGVASPAVAPAAKPETPARKTAKKKAAAPAKKRVARKKAATSATSAGPGKKTVRAEAASQSAASPASSGPAREATVAGRSALSRDARQRMIGEAAYLISLKRHAGLTGPEADWLYAETVIDLVFDITD
jgi:hypothetical protein